MKRAHCWALLAFALTGCHWQTRQCPTEPLIVEVPVPVREPVPAELTAPLDASMCEIEGPTVGDVRKQRARACAEITVGNDRLDRIRTLRANEPK